VKNKLKAINEEFERPTHDSNKHEHESQGILKRHNGTMVQLPTFPDWFYTHPFMTNDFAHGSIKGGTPITLGSNFYFVNLFLLTITLSLQLKFQLPPRNKPFWRI